MEEGRRQSAAGFFSSPFGKAWPVFFDSRLARFCRCRETRGRRRKRDLEPLGPPQARPAGGRPGRRPRTPGWPAGSAVSDSPEASRTERPDGGGSGRSFHRFGGGPRRPGTDGKPGRGWGRSGPTGPTGVVAGREAGMIPARTGVGRPACRFWKTVQAASPPVGGRRQARGAAHRTKAQRGRCGSARWDPPGFGRRRSGRMAVQKKNPSRAAPGSRRPGAVAGRGRNPQRQPLRTGVSEAAAAATPAGGQVLRGRPTPSRSAQSRSDRAAQDRKPPSRKRGLGCPAGSRPRQPVPPRLEVTAALAGGAAGPAGVQHRAGPAPESTTQSGHARPASVGHRARGRAGQGHKVAGRSEPPAPDPSHHHQARRGRRVTTARRAEGAAGQVVERAGTGGTPDSPRRGRPARGKSAAWSACRPANGSPAPVRGNPHRARPHGRTSMPHGTTSRPSRQAHGCRVPAVGGVVQLRAVADQAPGTFARTPVAGTVLARARRARGEKCSRRRARPQRS